MIADSPTSWSCEAACRDVKTSDRLECDAEALWSQAVPSVRQSTALYCPAAVATSDERMFHVPAQPEYLSLHAVLNSTAQRNKFDLLSQSECVFNPSKPDPSNCYTLQYTHK